VGGVVRRVQSWHCFARQGIAVMLLGSSGFNRDFRGPLQPAAMEIMAIAAGICGATAGLARTGILDDKPHANAPEYFRQRTIRQPSIKPTCYHGW